MTEQAKSSSMSERETSESEADAPNRKWRPTHLLLVTGFLAIAGFWIWAFSPLPTRGHPDTLDDKAFPAAAEVRCAATLEQLDTLPRDWDIDNPEQLAEQVAAGTELLVPQVADLRNLARTISDSDEARKVGLWLDDWDVYIADRNNLVAKLRQGERAEFIYTARNGVQIARILNRFAEVNNMLSCRTPMDI